LLIAGVLEQVTLVISRYVVDETRRNISRKSSQALPFFEAFLTRGLVEFAEPPAALVRQTATVVVAKDAEIVAGAVHARATFVATYDQKDLLSKREEIFAAFGVTVATPREILDGL
jgi:predicted nucleic acid-binding protein